ncbi:hypothetical protein F9802_03405 [Bacillus aerolatus]|uniref:Uncharacterized protein n=1 Tax=Bacillus aerolatus TaxID=2653354 RepID=A0A6I1G0M0_9BACI|nr:hypothetical protein [Bacillus aerolatus]KAB7709166.1 hypothetical protein F9802_03405 [Bacillus aerolatus]
MCSIREHIKTEVFKWNGDEWEHVYPTRPQTEEYGYSPLPPGEQLKKEINISDLKPGVYRLENGVIAEQTDIREGQQLAVTFEVGEK